VKEREGRSAGRRVRLRTLPVRLRGEEKRGGAGGGQRAVTGVGTFVFLLFSFVWLVCFSLVGRQETPRS